MLDLANPWALLAVPLPWVIWRCLAPSPISKTQALPLPFFQALSQYLAASSGRRRRDFLFWSLLWLLVLFAFSGPRWQGDWLAFSGQGHNIMLALDISGSMDLGDMRASGRPVTRLAVVQHAAKRFVAERNGDNIGLILFGTRAYLQTPLTQDRRNLMRRIDDATAGLAGQSTSIGDAIGLAVKQLKKVPLTGRVMILLTDGVNNSGVLNPIKAAEIAKDEGIRIYTIGLGGEEDEQSMSQLLMSMNGVSDLDEASLKKIAAETGGQYYRANDLDSLQRIYASINKLEKVEQAQRPIRPLKEYYPWPLALAIWLLIAKLLAFVWQARRPPNA